MEVDGDKLRKLLNDKGLKGSELARALEVSQVTVHRWKKGSPMKDDLFWKAIELLNAAPGDIVPDSMVQKVEEMSPRYVPHRKGHTTDYLLKYIKGNSLLYIPVSALSDFTNGHPNPEANRDIHLVQIPGFEGPGLIFDVISNAMVPMYYPGEKVVTDMIDLEVHEMDVGRPYIFSMKEKVIVRLYGGDKLNDITLNPVSDEYPSTVVKQDDIKHIFKINRFIGHKARMH